VLYSEANVQIQPRLGSIAQQPLGTLQLCMLVLL